MWEAAEWLRGEGLSVSLLMFYTVSPEVVFPHMEILAKEPRSSDNILWCVFSKKRLQTALAKNCSIFNWLFMLLKGVGKFSVWGSH